MVNWTEQAVQTVGLAALGLQATSIARRTNVQLRFFLTAQLPRSPAGWQVRQLRRHKLYEQDYSYVVCGLSVRFIIALSMCKRLTHVRWMLGLYGSCNYVSSHPLPRRRRVTIECQLGGVETPSGHACSRPRYHNKQTSIVGGAAAHRSAAVARPTGTDPVAWRRGIAVRREQISCAVKSAQHMEWHRRVGRSMHRHYTALIAARNTCSTECWKQQRILPWKSDVWSSNNTLVCSQMLCTYLFTIRPSL